MRFVVDIGSNSVKYLAAKMEQGEIKVLAMGSAVSGLGRGLHKEGLLSEESQAETLKHLSSFKDAYDEMASRAELHIVGTAALRSAKNSKEFCEKVYKLWKHPVEIISGSKESKISRQGAKSACPPSWDLERTLFVDIGGASTELGSVAPEDKGLSIKMGAVLSHEEMGFDHNALSDEQWLQGKDFVHKKLEDSGAQKFFQKWSQFENIVAVGGTLVMAARAAGAKELSEDIYLLTPELFVSKAEEYRKMSEAERLKEKHMVKGRADVLATGMLILKGVMESCQSHHLIFTTRGLRHGVIIGGSTL